MDYPIIGDTTLTLDFSKKPVGDAACEYLTNHLKECLNVFKDQSPWVDQGDILVNYSKQIISLDLQNCNITDKGVNMLITMMQQNPDFRNIIQIDLRGNKISEQMIDELKKFGIACKFQVGDKIVTQGKFVSDEEAIKVEVSGSRSSAILQEMVNTKSEIKRSVKSGPKTELLDLGSVVERKKGDESLNDEDKDDTNYHGKRI